MISCPVDLTQKPDVTAFFDEDTNTISYVVRDPGSNACAIYLPNKGLDKSALIDGVGTAKPPEMAARLIADNTRVMSF